MDDIVDKMPLTDEEKDNILDDIMGIFEERIKLKDLKAIAEAANYETDRVKKAYQIAKNSKKEIPNLVGFMISAIKGEWEDTPKKNNESDSANNSNSFNQFEQRDIDFNELEEKLLAK